MPVTALTPIEADIVAAAEAYGVDPRLALSTAQVESGLNPTAVGDQGTSFGLYQLHQGGELGNLTPAQAFNPVTNADTALAELGSVTAAHPGADPGALAAAAQRPANQTAYAQAVDSVYNNPADFPQVPAGTTPAATATLTSSSGGVGGIVGSIVGGAVPGLGLGSGLLNDITGGLVDSTVGKAEKGAFAILLTISFVAAALGLVLLGLTRIFPGVTRTVTTAAVAA